MRLPDHSFTLHGGCNCGSIRYRITVPELCLRPTHPRSKDGDIHFPLIAADHCNDCRDATGSILPAWICAPADMLSVSFRPAPSPPSFKHDRNNTNTVEAAIYHPAMTALRQNSPESRGSTLRWYVSSPNRTRTFCGHCGTNLTYAILPMVEGYPDIYDVVLGTLDRGDFEKGWVQPERCVWWGRGVGWVQGMMSQGLGGPRHDTGDVSVCVE